MTPEQKAAAVEKYRPLDGTPQGYQWVVIRSALRVYANTGIKVNTAYTPKNMTDFAAKQTGKVYPASKKGCLEAYNDLDAIITEARRG